MKNELLIKKCLKCGTLIEIINYCNCEINCCNEPMVNLVSNSVNANFENHIPTYEIIDDEINVKVNHVMEEEHSIVWIALSNEKNIEKVKLSINQKAKLISSQIKSHFSILSNTEKYYWDRFIK